MDKKFNLIEYVDFNLIIENIQEKHLTLDGLANAMSISISKLNYLVKNKGNPKFDISDLLIMLEYIGGISLYSVINYNRLISDGLKDYEVILTNTPIKMKTLFQISHLKTFSIQYQSITDITDIYKSSGEATIEQDFQSLMTEVNFSFSMYYINMYKTINDYFTYVSQKPEAKKIISTYYLTDISYRAYGTVYFVNDTNNKKDVELVNILTNTIREFNLRCIDKYSKRGGSKRIYKKYGDCNEYLRTKREALLMLILLRGEDIYFCEENYSDIFNMYETIHVSTIKQYSFVGNVSTDGRLLNYKIFSPYEKKTSDLLTTIKKLSGKKGLKKVKVYDNSTNEEITFGSFPLSRFFTHEQAKEKNGLVNDEKYIQISDNQYVLRITPQIYDNDFMENWPLNKNIVLEFEEENEDFYLMDAIEVFIEYCKNADLYYRQKIELEYSYIKNLIIEQGRRLDKNKEKEVIKAYSDAIFKCERRELNQNKLS